MRSGALRLWLAPALLLAAPMLVGCGTAGEAEAVGVDGPAGGEPATQLVVTVNDGAGGPPLSWTLTCDPAGGNHPDPAAACRTLDAARAPFAQVPPGVLCTQVYGGPQTAIIEGTFRGEPVRAGYRRTDGCEIGRWDALVPVLPSASSS